MTAIYRSIIGLLNRVLWESPHAAQSKVKSATAGLLRLLFKLAKEFREGQITVRAASLVYTTILSLVPFLALAFSVLKALGVHNKLQLFLYGFLEPLGEKGEDLTISIVSFVENINVGVLGLVGLFLLLYTVISSVQQVESAFNYTWQITKERGFLRKFRDYLSAILAGPLLLVSAIGITTTILSNAVTKKLQSIEPIGTVIFVIGRLTPYALVILSFTLVYYLLPNTKVKFRSALIGGVAAGLFWQTGGWAYAAFVVSSSNYPAIYSGFAIILFFMVWLYYNWIILLLGSKISFYHQYPDLLALKDERLLSSDRLREKVALAIMYLIGYGYYHNNQRWTMGTLVKHLRLPLKYIQDTLEALSDHGMLLMVSEDMSYLPAMDLEKISLNHILAAVRIETGERNGILKRIEALSEIDAIMARIDEAGYRSVENETLKDLVIRGIHRQ